MKFEVLFKDGDWRIARATGAGYSVKNGRWVIVQHECGKNREHTSMYTDGDWSYCWYEGKKCSVCKCAVLPRMVGFHEMILWDNEEDMP